MKYIIGITAYYHDSSVCLFKNGSLIYACEEEKFTGIKHDNSFPIKSLSYIIKKYKIKRNEIEAICFYEDPNIKFKRVLNNVKSKLLTNPVYSIKSIFKVLKNKHTLKKELQKYCDNVFYSKHHESHLYYSYYTSNFKDAIALSIDGVGEIDTAAYGVFSTNKSSYTSLGEYPNSLGLFYSAMTAFLGFKPNEGEYKVMGLASYGDHRHYIKKVRELISFKNGKIETNMEMFCWDSSNKEMFNYKLSEHLNILPRHVDSKITQKHMNLAAAVQKRYEEIFFEILNSIHKQNPTSNITLGGGCAYNGTANGKINKKSKFKNIWIPPAPSDAGSSIGACINYLVNKKRLKYRLPKNPFLGPDYQETEIYMAIKGKKFKRYFVIENLVKKIATELNKGKIVGWYWGHIEFGARALGNRSILANPTLPDMKDRINKLVKKREMFRPFAPMVTKDKQHIFFEMFGDIPYMNQIVKVKKEYIDKLPAVTHVDGTARVQTVYQNTIIYDLLTEFEKQSGFPILLNTSFNIKDKTMVLTPKDAIDTFDNSEIDILVINNFLIEKK